MAQVSRASVTQSGRRPKMQGKIYLLLAGPVGGMDNRCMGSRPSDGAPRGYPRDCGKRSKAPRPFETIRAFSEAAGGRLWIEACSASIHGLSLVAGRPGTVHRSPPPWL